MKSFISYGSIYSHQGSLISFISSFFSSPVRMLILGLDSAGKTTILYRISSGVTIMTVPTVGFNLEELEYEKMKFKVWDLGGQESLRPYWRCYYSNTNAIIFVVDSCDKERMELAGKELHFISQEKELKNSVIAVFANKQDDVAHAMPVEEIATVLKLTEMKDVTWSIFKTSGITGEGIMEGMSWIASKCK
ncbi:ADP-ribosylation factor, arf, putative [Entamoeba invadens IP1]|uniref:ADP-ribosylation factor, arf, putative n=1 Tax=Entamoeba invadens IP1 TaxID=370355 RepID=UPI0002C3DE5E|nr:ADP-ribosylation factor, arf, putative [Entamoeba invadens IP1]ELP93904.1 ADP-ribosylation factor, arf, putative [Entamoeba invadens IP1]|eukprot:XP_004260675.1 ADP-ribosylation factor, arf, putative [Entamoeba invadens IP1]